MPSENKQSYRMLRITRYLLFVVLFSCSWIATINQGLADEDTITLHPTADTFTLSDQEDANYGTSKRMEIYYYYELWEYIEDNETRYALEDYSYIYIMFDLTTVPSNFIVDYASLRLYVWMVIYPVYVGTFLCPNNTWDETALTWKNAPEALPYLSDNVYVSAEDASYSWDVTDFVKTAFGVYNLTLVLEPTMSGEGIGYAFFSTREDTDNPPELIINGRYMSPSDPSKKPDLTITDIIWSPTDPEENEQITFQACIENFGSIPSLSNFRVDFYVDATYAGYSEMGTIDAGGMIKSYPIIIQPLSTGTHVVEAIVDATKIIEENNEQNNGLQREVTVKPTSEEPIVEYGPDLIVTGITWSPENPSYEDQITFYVYVENCGNEPSVPIFDIEIWVDDLYQGRAQLGTIEIGETKRSNPIITYPMSDGFHTVKAIVDSKNSVSETDENNNEYETQINVIPEFPSAAIPLILIVLTMIAAFLARKKRPQTQ